MLARMLSLIWKLVFNSSSFWGGGALRLPGFSCNDGYLFLLTGLILGLGWWYYAGIAFATAILVYEHSLVHPQDLSLVNVASFKVNRYVSLVMFIATLADLL